VCTETRGISAAGGAPIFLARRLAHADAFRRRARFAVTLLRKVVWTGGRHSRLQRLARSKIRERPFSRSGFAAPASCPRGRAPAKQMALPVTGGEADGHTLSLGMAQVF
jgi:hypothetical protein